MPKVLVVDDVPANVKLLEARLTAEYFDVITAMNGAEALAVCERSECDLVTGEQSAKIADCLPDERDAPARLAYAARRNEAGCHCEECAPRHYLVQTVRQ